MKKIKIKGKKRELNCNGLAIVTYQRITGVNPFNIDSHTEEQKAMYDYVMGWSMLSKADQEELQLDDIMESLDTLEKMQEFSTAVAEELTRFYKNEPGDKDETDRHEVNAGDDDGEGGDKYKKNA